MSDLSQLLEFGFDEKRAKRALRKTKNAGLQPALDYLQDHEGSDGEDSGVDENAAGAGMDVDSAAGAPAEAKSLKCLDCGKVFRTTAEASYHGDKSGHANFEESTEEKKALTEEEKKDKLAELRAKAAARKAAAAKTDAEDQRKNDAIRRKADQDLGKIKEDLKLKEAEKEAKQRKQDKIDDAKAKAKIKAQIEEDKRARAEKAAREKALREGREPTTTATSVGNVSNSAAGGSAGGGAASAKSATNSSDAPQTRLQVRLPSGQPLVITRDSQEKLADTVAFLKSEGQAIEGKVAVPFPRKTFSNEDMQKTLKELGLPPSSVIIVS